MNEEIDEYDIYHQDFTTVSDWEVFIARIEEVLNDWHLSKSNIEKRPHEFSLKWLEKSEHIAFQSLKFTISYHSLEPIQSSTVEEKPTSVTPLSTRLLNGVWEANKVFMDESDGGPFPVSSWFGLKRYVMLNPQHPLLEESHIRLVMSSINIAFSNVDCGVPLFLKVREHWQQCYLGLFEDKEFKTSFDTIHLKRIPNQCFHLNGLANLFKGKIGSPVPLTPVQMAAKFSYELKDIDKFSWKKSYVEEELFTVTDDKTCIELPFGADQNPVKSVMLHVMWPKFVENAVMDSSTYSDFDPIMAPIWALSIKMREDFDCLLTQSLNRLLDLYSMEQLIMDELGLSRSLGLVNPLHKITEAPITISKLVKAAMGSSNSNEFKGPISDEKFMPILYYLFPDAEYDDSNNSYPNELYYADTKICSYIKSSPVDNLVWRLSIAAMRLHDIGGLPYLAHLWYEFTQELQYRWERRITVPGVAAGDPNARSCLLHQKLQMLNTCILRSKSNTSLDKQSSDDDDDFYDASDGEGNTDTPALIPVGRLHPLEDAVMKNGAVLYVPLTQDPPPKTEDQLEEDAELMVRLGDDARASELRARMMSASLLSDMEAFKAANPGCELCDFVRWYSPRDWKPDDGGSLGDRMLLPDNPWVETWKIARPVCVARQRRLFDEIREAEQVLHYLRSRTVEGVVDLILPAILKAGAMKAANEGVLSSGVSAGGVDKKRLFEIAVRELCEAEKEASKIGLRKVILEDSVEDVPLDSSGRSRVLSSVGGTLPPVSRREFSMRVRDQFAPQAMRAVLGNDIFLVGAFTERSVLL